MMRVKPRYNAEVNEWWMCDEGRYGFKFIDQNRLTQVLAQGTQATWEAALEALASTLEKVKAQERQERIGILPSAQLTTEELFLVWRLTQALKIEKVSAQVPEQPGFSDNLLIKADKNPNTAGAQQIGFLGKGVVSASQLIEQAIEGEIRVLWVFGHDLVALFGEEKVKMLAEKLELFVFQGSNANGTSRYAHWVLPSATYAEKDGVFVNCHGRAQRIFKAFDPLKVSRPDWEILLEVGSRLKVPLAMKSPEEIFAAIGELFEPFCGLTYEKLGSIGVVLAQAGKPKKDVTHVG